MKYKYAFYASRGASRITKFYEVNSLSEFKFEFEFIYYDGNDDSVINRLKLIFGNNNIIIPKKNKIRNIKGRELSQFISNELLHNMQTYNIDYLFCFGNMILKPNLIDAYQNKIINFHPSLLPAFPGVNSIDKALSTSVQLLGNTAHFVDAGIDTGPIILQSVISRNMFKDYDSVLDLQIEMLKKIWNWLENNNILVENNLIIIKDGEKSKLLSS
jgi:phosphoribosylglycinamide formyltransferase 1